MAEMIYTFAATATRMDGDLTSLKGMRRLADVLHPHGVKITWLVSKASAEAMKEQLTEWYEEYGDDVGISVSSSGVADADLLAVAKKARQDVKAILPWTNAEIAAGAHQDARLIPVLEEAGFTGLWGFCWEQIEVDGITDRGCPWGFYYVDPTCRTAPNTGKFGLLGMEWTARDLLKAFHSGNPCIYSTDVNDVSRGGICSWDDVEYLRGMFDNYYANMRFNDLILYQVHQEAHEMMPEFRCYSEEDIREAEVMLEELTAYVMMHEGVRAETLPEAARIYRDRSDRTIPSHMLWEDTPTCSYNDEYARGTARGPWPKSYLYYDADCQMMFIDGKFEPVAIRNYRNRDAKGYFVEQAIPRVRFRSHTRSPYGMDLDLTIESPKDMPFGFTIWEDFGPYLLAEAPGCIDHKIISQELLFMRYDVKAGSTDLHIHFNRK